MVYISKIRVRNFKSLEDVTVKLKPLTLLIGKNSSGKSSFIKAILFVQKNLFPLRFKDFEYKLSSEVNLESYEDIVLNHDLNKEIVFEFTFTGTFLFFADWLMKYNKSNTLNLEKYFNDIYTLGVYETSENIYNYNKNLNELYTNYIEELEDISSQVSIGPVPDIHQDFVQTYPCKTKVAYTYSYDQFAYLKKIEFEDTIYKLKTEYLYDKDSKHIKYSNWSFSKSNINDLKTKELVESNIDLFNPFWRNHNFCENNTLISLSELLNDDIKFKKKYYPDVNIKSRDKNFKPYDQPAYFIGEKRIDNSEVKILSCNEYIKEKYRREYKLDLNNSELLNLYFIASKLEYSQSYIIPKAIELNLNSKHIPPTRETPKPKYFLNTQGKFEENIYYSFPNIIYDDYQKTKNTVFSIENNNTLNKKSNISLAEIISTINKYSQNIKTNTDVTKNDTPLFCQINSKLKIFGYDYYFFVDKNIKKDVGYLYIADRKGNKYYLSNESSGLIQLLPIIITLILNKPFEYSDFAKEAYVIPIEDIRFIEYKDKESNHFQVLIEQPELHLHPKAQSELANLIVDTLKEKNFHTRCIIETHSEHLVNRLQVLISKKLILTKDVSIQYFDNENDKTKIKTIKIHQNGLFKDNWPEGFLDQSYNNSVDLLFGSN